MQASSTASTPNPNPNPILPLLLTLTLTLTLPLAGEFDRLLSVRVLHREGDAALDQGADGAQTHIRHRCRCYALAMGRKPNPIMRGL